MSDTTTLTVRVPRALSEALDDVAAEARTSKSEVVREYLTDSVIESDEPLPDHIRQEMKRERLKRKNRLTWQKVHFPSNVADRFRRAFEQGDLDDDLNPGAVEDIREMHVEDAELLFEDEPERREAAVEFVKALSEHASQASDASDFDRLDPEEMFERYAGVEDGRAMEGIEFESIVSDARERMQRLQESPAATFKADDLKRSLSKEYGISDELAAKAVEKAQRGGA